MKIHHLRNATFVIESGTHFILIDPMLIEKGKLAPFSIIFGNLYGCLGL